MVKNVLEIALVHHKPLIEDYDPVCHTGNRIQVMGDKDHRCLVFLLDPQQFVQDKRRSHGQSESSSDTSPKSDLRLEQKQSEAGDAEQRCHKILCMKPNPAQIGTPSRSSKAPR